MYITIETIGTLGPDGSYSGMVTKNWIKKSRKKDIEIVYFSDTSDVIAAVKARSISTGIVPIENLLEGVITSTLDLLSEQYVRICGEIFLKISHCFLVHNTNIAISAILSHPQALAQCKSYLKLHYPDVALIPTTSTSAAAASASKTDGIAAIASRGAAEKFNLQISAENIQEKTNYTRFIVICNRDTLTTGNDKTSIIVYPGQNKPGVLHEILGEFAKRKIDLTMVETRPTKEIFGEYIFHIDLKGHKNEPVIKEALKSILEKQHTLTILGSYPIANLNGEM